MIRLVCAGLLVGCGGAAKAPLDLSWHFADGRSCDDSSVASVWVKGGGVDTNYFCGLGLQPATIHIAAVTHDGTLQLQALSHEQSPLYRGALGLDQVADQADVVLYADLAR